MNKIFFTLALFATSLAGWAQNANMVFFSEGGEAFYVILNGERFNQQPLTNVKVNGLMEQVYQCKIIFADESLGIIDKKIYPENNVLTTMQIKRKSESQTNKGLKKIGNRISKDLKREFDNDTVSTADKEDWYVMRIMSKAAIQPQTTAVSNQTAQVYPNNVDAATATTRSSSTVTTTTQTNVPDEQVNVRMNVNMNGTGVGVDMQATETYNQSSTTTVTSTGTATDHYVMPGYAGSIGCPWPMNDQEFGSAVNSVRSKDFEDTKLTVAKQIVGNNCMFASQVRDMMGAFDFEDSKLEFAKFAYPHTYDQNNYYKVNDAFEFESSIDDLNRAIGH